MTGHDTQHREGEIDGIANKCGSRRAVWHEHEESMVAAIEREKLPKKFRSDLKINVIERDDLDGPTFT